MTDTPRTLPDALAGAASGDTGYTFVSGGGDTFRPYAEVRAAALGVARAFRDAGLRSGDVVALVLPDEEQFLTVLFGATIARVIPASLYAPAATGELSRYLDVTKAILQASAARAVVTSAALAPAFADLRGDCPDLAVVLTRGDLDGPPGEPDALPGLDDIAFVQYTSGSTSAPKGVALTHRNVAANVDAINGPGGLATAVSDVAVSWLPLNHDMGFVGMALGPLYSGCHGVLLPPQAFVKRPIEWLRTIARFRGTISFAPNFGYDLCVRRVKERDLDRLDLSSWRIAGCGAEPVHAATLDAFAEKFAACGFRASSFLPSYGLAEHVLAATFSPRDRGIRSESVDATRLTNERRAVPPGEGDTAVTLVSCGVPLPGHELRIAAPGGEPLPERRVGEILLGGPSVMLGYYRHESATAETIRGGWLHTGDLGYLADGELFVCGRIKDVIIVNGRKYHPQDLEWAVDALAGVRRGRVAAFAVARLGRADRVVIVVEPSGTVAADALVDAVRRRIGDLFGLFVDDVALVPSGTVARTTSGKVQRSATKAQYELHGSSR